MGVTCDGEEMKKRSLNFNPKAQLQHILEDYPGGQLLSEALQNAEDGGASQFTLLLDMRQHAVQQRAIGGPAFVLIDNGVGFFSTRSNLCGSRSKRKFFKKAQKP